MHLADIHWRAPLCPHFPRYHCRSSSGKTKAPYGAPYGFYAPYNNAGTVKIDSKTTDAESFVNGSYAGTVKNNKTMHLSQGNYTIEIRHAGETTFSESVYVTAGKTLHITPAV